MSCFTGPKGVKKKNWKVIIGLGAAAWLQATCSWTDLATSCGDLSSHSSSATGSRSGPRPFQRFQRSIFFGARPFRASTERSPQPFVERALLAFEDWHVRSNRVALAMDEESNKFAKEAQNLLVYI